MLTSRFGFGYGMGYSAYKEAKALVELGHSITVIHCYNDSEIAFFKDSKIKLINLPIAKTPLLGILIYFFKLRSFIREKIRIADYDAVYIQSLEFGLLNFSTLKIPVFYFARSTMRGMKQALNRYRIKSSFSFWLVRNLLTFLEMRCMRYSKKIFVKSKRMVGEVVDLYGIKVSKIIVVTGGIDKEIFKLESNDDIKKFKLDSGIPESETVFLYAGRIVPQKGLEYLVKAALRLLKDKKFAVVIAGAEVDKAYASTVRKLINQSKYKDSFFLLGHINQNDMSLVHSIADCLVTPSLYEPFGMVNLQAAFLGIGVITTVEAGSADVLENYNKVSFVKAGSETDLRKTMSDFIDNPSVYSTKTFDFKDYSWDCVAQQLQAYFLEVA